MWTARSPRRSTAADLPFEAFRDIYAEAYALGLKGCTTFRPNAVTGAVLTPAARPASAAAGPAAVIPPTAAAASAALPRVMPASAAAVGPGTGGTGESLSGPDRSDIVYMARPLARDDVLPGYTYKLRWPGSDHAIYVTINDIVRDGRRRPFEIFINSKNLEHYAWMVALTRMISAVFRRGGDVSFIAEELGAIFDPQGGRWLDGRYVPSLQAAIGSIIETHMRRIGALAGVAGATGSGDGGREPGLLAATPAGGALLPPDAPQAGSGRQELGARSSPVRGGGSQSIAAQDVGRAEQAGRACHRCGAGAVVREGRCWVCRNCGFARCG